MKFVLIAVLGLAVGLPAIIEAQAAHAQRAQGVTILGGAFMDERGEGGHHPYVSARYERWLSRFAAFEGGVTHARSERLLISQTFAESRLVSTAYTSLDLGMQLQLPFKMVQPYMGATTGGTYFDGSSYLGSEAGLTHALVAGARVGPFGNVGLRGEFRLRRDDIGDVAAYNGEYGLGLTYRF